MKVIEQCFLFSQEDHGHFLEGITAQQTNLQHDLDWSEVAERVTYMGGCIISKHVVFVYSA